MSISTSTVSEQTIGALRAKATEMRKDIVRMVGAANGMAMAAKLDKKDYRIFVMIGDGESQEGTIWEGAMAAAHYKLDNLTAILDWNGLQIDGPNITDAARVAQKHKEAGL